MYILVKGGSVDIIGDELINETDDYGLNRFLEYERRYCSDIEF